MAYLEPFAKGLLNKTLDVVKDQLSRVDMQEAADATKALAGRGFEAAKIGAANIDVMEIAVATKDFAVAHPYFVGGQLVGTAIGIAPSWVSVPILSAMGFGPTGVAVGECTRWKIMLRYTTRTKSVQRLRPLRGKQLWGTWLLEARSPTLRARLWGGMGLGLLMGLCGGLLWRVRLWGLLLQLGGERSSSRVGRERVVTTRKVVARVGVRTMGRSFR